MATMTEQVSKLLDFSQKLDITLLENIVGCMYTGTGDQVSLFVINQIERKGQSNNWVYSFLNKIMLNNVLKSQPTLDI